MVHFANGEYKPNAFQQTICGAVNLRQDIGELGSHALPGFGLIGF
jgi:hypothetical protein